MSPLDTAVLAIGLSLTAVLTYGALSLYVAANRPGDRPTWVDLCAFVAAVAGATWAGLQRIAAPVVKS